MCTWDMWKVLFTNIQKQYNVLKISLLFKKISLLFKKFTKTREFLNPGVPCSKPLGGSKVDSAFHPFEVDKVSTRNFWGLSGKT